MRVFSDTFLVLVTTSECFAQLHSIIYWETVVEQFIVKLAKCPVSFIVSYLLCVEVIGFVCEVIGQQEDATLSSQ